MIRLSFGGYSIEVITFGRYPSEYPRIAPQWFRFGESVRGATSRRGTSYRPKHFFRFDALLTLTQQETLERMMGLYLDTPGPWTLDDYTKPFSEKLPRTRALAPNGVEDADASTVRYPARFNVEPDSDPTYREWSEVEDLVSFGFKETEAILA